MTDAFYPRNRRRSLLEDPDLAATVRPAGAPPPDDGSGASFNYARQRMTPAAPEQVARSAQDRARLETAWRESGAAAVWRETGQQAIGGADDALRETLNAFDPALRFVEERIGVNLPRYQGFNIEKGETGAGEFIRDASRFLTAFIPAVRVLKAAGMGHKIAGTVASGVSEALSRNPVEKNFFDFVDKHEAVRGPVYEFLGADPGDREAVRRLENALEGAGLGKLAGLVTQMGRTILQARLSNKTVRDLVMEAAEGGVHTGLHKGLHAYAKTLADAPDGIPVIDHDLGVP